MGCSRCRLPVVVGVGAGASATSVAGADAIFTADDILTIVIIGSLELGFDLVISSLGLGGRRGHGHFACVTMMTAAMAQGQGAAQGQVKVSIE